MPGTAIASRSRQSIPRPSRRSSSATFVLDTPGQARVLFHPLRLEILQLLDEPRSCGELADQLGNTPQRVQYHVKALEAAGVVVRVGERKVRALTEGIYQAVARHYWPGAELLAQLGGNAEAQSALSKSYLLALAEELGKDAARLVLGTSADRPQETQTLGLSAQVCLADARRRGAFLQELQETMQRLAEKYGSADGPPGSETFKLVLACYRTEDSAGVKPLKTTRKK